MVAEGRSRIIRKCRQNPRIASRNIVTLEFNVSSKTALRRYIKRSKCSTSGENRGSVFLIIFSKTWAYVKIRGLVIIYSTLEINWVLQYRVTLDRLRLEWKIKFSIRISNLIPLNRTLISFDIWYRKSTNFSLEKKKNRENGLIVKNEQVTKLIKLAIFRIFLFIIITLLNNPPSLYTSITITLAWIIAQIISDIL